jgi:hypothetical protein
MILEPGPVTFGVAPFPWQITKNRTSRNYAEVLDRKPSDRELTEFRIDDVDAHRMSWNRSVQTSSEDLV